MGERKRTYLIRSVPEAEAQAPSEPQRVPQKLEQLAQRLFQRSRQELIAEAAYYRAERRGFQGGNPDQDWLEAEAEVEQLLRDSRPW